jgi:hypothetical protein
MVSPPPKTLAFMMTYFLLFAFGLTCTVAQIENHEKFFASEESVAGSYIVVLNDNASSLSSVSGFSDSYIKFRYDAVLNGYALQDIPEYVLAEILESSLVEAVYEDGVVYEDETTDESTQPVTEPWGLDR